MTRPFPLRVPRPAGLVVLRPGSSTLAAEAHRLPEGVPLARVRNGQWTDPAPNFRVWARALLLPVAAALLAGGAAARSPLHPAIVLRDEAGAPVLTSGGAVSPSKTCGECHDTDYIEGHSYHAAAGADEAFPPGRGAGSTPWSTSPGLFGRFDPLLYRRLSVPGEAAFDLGVADWIRTAGLRHVGGGPAFRSRTGAPLAGRVAAGAVDPETHVLGPAGGPVPWDWAASGAVEMDCFLCHLAAPDGEARAAALVEGRFRWAATATLSRTGLVRRGADGSFGWVREAFAADGTVSRETLGIGDPRSENCGLCHGEVSAGPDPVVVRHGPSAWETETKGQVFGAQRVDQSALNLAGKEGLARPWDVHAARLVSCTDCHPSLNNPAAFAEATRSRPRHLAYDARRLEIGDYLERPSHHFAKGESAQGNVARRLDASMRRCEDCHDAESTHAVWLPNPKRHLSTLLCETCHVPSVPAPALSSVDWTVLSPGKGPRLGHRGVAGRVDDPAALVTPWEPVVLPRVQKDGRTRHGPHNLVTSWWWVGGEPARPVRLDRLVLAWFDGEAYRPELVAALDEDRDGELAETELRLDTPAKVAAVRSRLEAVGVASPRIEGQVQPLSLHHGVVPGRFATRRCEACHASDSRMTRPFEVAAYVPAGAEARLVPDTNVRLAGRMERTADGRLVLVPSPTEAGRYVLGHDRAGWIDVLGVLLVLGTAGAVAVHAALRALHARRRGRSA